MTHDPATGTNSHKEVHNMMTKIKSQAIRLYEYIKYRAEYEGVAFDLTPDFFRQAIEVGKAEFFGVTFDEYGWLVDNQNPEAFSEWDGDSQPNGYDYGTNEFYIN
jgi:hypothetical protein